jgi:hypothetical protein
VCLSNGPPMLEAQSSSEVDPCLELRWAPRRARVGFVGQTRATTTAWEMGIDRKVKCPVEFKTGRGVSAVEWDWPLEAARWL